MSKPSPYNLTIGEDGLSVRCEWDAHYLTDEQMETVRRHVETLQAENAKLRELVLDYDKVLDAAVDVWGIMADVLGYGRKYDALHDRMRELGVEV